MLLKLPRKLRSANIILHPQKLLYAPQWLVLGVNNLCNLHCKMCDVGTQTNDTNFAVNLVGTQPRDMPMELFRMICDQTAQYFPDTKLGYAFTEPLIYPHLIESLEYAQQKKLYTSVTTNALNLKKYAADLCKAGLNDIMISLDGPEEIHNFIRGHKSSFQRAIEGMELLLEQPNRPEISIFCVITEWNTAQLKIFADFFKKYPLKKLGFMHTNFTQEPIASFHNQQWGHVYPATVSNIAETQVETTNLDELWDQIQAIKKTSYPFQVVFSPEVKTKEALDNFYLHPEKLIGKRCNDAFANIMIKSDGSVIPAHGRCYNLTAGNLYSENLKAIWNSTVLSTFRKDLMKAGGLFPACSRCCSAF
jgi:MoaA/NifB/PqqE/SkfB family radical SAM enzyme